MKEIRLGKTEIRSPKNGFGALPVQRVTEEEAVALLRRAYAGGFRFFDTARSYTDSEKKVGLAFEGMREKVFIATKTAATTVEGFWKDLETSLSLLKTDYIDLYQLHNPAFCPRPGDGSGLYEALTEAKARGMIRHIGITNHRPHVAREAVESGLYECLQFPFCYLATEEDRELVELCKAHDVGFIAMKALSGGLLTNARACYAWLDGFDNVLPIWGIQREEELSEFLSFFDAPPALTEELACVVEEDRAHLLGDFCRGCGYCMPCPAGIEINNAARMAQLIRRSPSAQWLTPEWQAKMEKIEGCLSCGKCLSKCPYHLPTPDLLRRNLEDYRNIVSGKIKL